MLKRAWINQPSESQPFHHLHGVNVLADVQTINDVKVIRVYFLQGKVLGQNIPISCLSDGWNNISESKGE